MLSKLQDLRSVCTMWMTARAHVCVCVYLHAGSCVSVSVSVCLARIDTQTGLISRDLWALTGCRLVSTATTKGWCYLTYPDGALHPRAHCHAEHRGGPASRCREVPVRSWERERGQHAVGVARCLWWVCQEICCQSKLQCVLLDLLFLSCVKLKSMKFFLFVPKTTYCTFKSLPECELVYFPKSQAFSKGTCGVWVCVVLPHFFGLWSACVDLPVSLWMKSFWQYKYETGILMNLQALWHSVIAFPCLVFSRKRIHQPNTHKQQNHPGPLGWEFDPESRHGGLSQAAHFLLELNGPGAEEHHRPCHHHAQPRVQVKQHTLATSAPVLPPRWKCSLTSVEFNTFWFGGRLAEALTQPTAALVTAAWESAVVIQRMPRGL